MWKRLPIPLLIAAIALLVLPQILLALGLTMTSASEVVIFAIACMALNILVGQTGLVSFGHGAWFGLAAYAAALLQRNLMHDSFFGPAIAGVVIVTLIAAAFGFLILRRRGVYFSLLTLALSAMLYAVSFRWTEVTGGENGLGGITRPTLLGFNLESSTPYYWFVAAIAFLVLILLWRFHHSSVGHVLVAIRENEQRARFLGYPTNRYKLAAFVLSAGITGLAGIEKAEAALLSYGGQRLLDMGVALATAPRVLLLDEPLAGLAAAERERIGAIIKRISADLPVLLVEHDIDRVFQLADHVTVMNEGKVLLDGTVEDARQSAKVQEVYIGSGAAHVASRPRRTAARVNALLSAENVNTFYGKSHILNAVSLDVREHEIVALLGRNGAGKSTLLKTLIGIAPASHGSIRLGEAELIGNSSAGNARLGIGYVPQGRGLFAGMSVEQNLELGALKRQTGHGVHWTRERIYEYFPRIRERLDTPADYLSGGEQQMVAVARALSGDVRVLLLDEPFEGLAPAVVEQLFETFDRLRQEVAIVIVDHHLDLALALSDTTVALERGRVIHQGPSQALRDDLDLRRKVLWL